MIKEFQSNSSLIDFLRQIMPDFNGFIVMRRPRNNKAAQALFSLWQDETNKIEDAEKAIKRSATTSKADIELMEREGLIKQRGEKLEITSKGADVIKTMILGDDRSIWEEKKGGPIDYETAFANTKPKRTKTAKHASRDEGGNWYKRMK